MVCAHPQETGKIQVLLTTDYSTSSDRTDDDVLYWTDIEYGFAPNHHLSFKVETLLGDGAGEGNGNLDVEWQWRFWKEDGWLPAFGLSNDLFIPSGCRSGGADWTLTGLVTKSLAQHWRLHLNPFLTVASGDSPDPHDDRSPGDLRDFQWGVIGGTDYAITDEVALSLDYVHETSDARGQPNQHSMETGVMWAIDQHHGLAASTRWTVDGDSISDNWGAAVTYSYTFSAPTLASESLPLESHACWCSTVRAAVRGASASGCRAARPACARRSCKPSSERPCPDRVTRTMSFAARG
jgi:hypothetical protein